MGWRTRRFDHLRDDVGRAVRRQGSGQRRQRDGRSTRASSGTCSHAMVKSAAAETARPRQPDDRVRDIMKSINILIAMDLAGQAKRRRRSKGGYAMAALLIGMSIMAIMFTVAMPVWKQTAQREKEEELVFRGEQYVHAIGALSAQVRERVSAEPRCPGRSAVSAQEVQGSDHQRRLRADSSRSGCARYSATRWSARCDPIERQHRTIAAAGSGSQLGRTGRPGPSTSTPGQTAAASVA